MDEKVSLKKLLGFGSLIDNETYMQLLEYQIKGAKYVNVPAGTLFELEKRANIQKEKEQALNNTAKLNNKGIAYEKSGKIKSAIRVYEENIIGCYPAHHSYKRLMVIYHKQKDYVNEIRVIKRALEVFGNYPEYVERLSKVKNKILKK